MVNQFDPLQNIEIAGDDKHNQRVKEFRQQQDRFRNEQNTERRHLESLSETRKIAEKANQKSLVANIIAATSLLVAIVSVLINIIR